jgi:ankyrin repeat protein
LKQIEGMSTNARQDTILTFLAETRKDIDTWLDAKWTNVRYDQCLEEQLEGTCNWIINVPAFQQWSSPNFTSDTAKLIWINGPPGHGKTITCARVIEHLLKTLRTPLVYYFYASDNESGDPFVIIRSWISQMMASCQPAFELAIDRWQSRNGPVASRKEIIELFGLIVQTVPHYTFVIDGLDECVHSDDNSRLSSDNIRSGFLQTLKHAVAKTTSRIMIMSRDESDIRNAVYDTTLGGAHLAIYEHRITKEDVQHDLLHYSESTIKEKFSDKTPAQREELSRQLIEGSHGMFLWVKLQASNLERRGKGKNNKQLGRIIEETPPGLDRLYERNWDEIERLGEPDRTRALAILRWAAFAIRPLTVREMTESVLVADEDDCDDILVDELPDALDKAYIDGQIIELCASLVEIREGSDAQSMDTRTIHLIHVSVKEYVLWRMTSSNLSNSAGLLRSSEAIQHNELAKVCLRYLNFKNVWKYPEISEDLATSRPFRLYATTSWHRHLMASGRNYPEVIQLINVLFNSANANWEPLRNWLDTTEQSWTTTKPLAEGPLTCPLYYASHFGIYETVLYLIEEMVVDVNHTDKFQRTALQAACVKGHVAIVKALLRKGATTAISDDSGRTPLYIGAMNGHVEVVKLLLENGADFTVASNSGWTPLKSASNNGHVEVVKLLLQNGADFTVASNSGWTPLKSASNNGHVEVVKLLLQNGADLTIGSNSGWTPLNSASESGHVEVVKLLLENGADLTIANNDRWTPLNSASNSGHVEVAKLLLENGADLTIANNNGWTPLHSASNKGHIEVVKLLLENRADLTIANNNGWTPLNSASDSGHVEVVKLLLENGADLTIASNSGWTPLNSASESGHVEVAKLLLENGADLTIANNDGWTPLYSASNKGHVEVVKLLLENRADLTIANNDRWTPLNSASNSGHVKVAKLLLENGADLTIANNDGWTPLNSASDSGHVEVVKLLLENGADLTIANNNGWTPLYSASNKGHVEVVKLLLNHGADPEAATAKGSARRLISLLHTSAYGGSLEVIRLWLDQFRFDYNSVDEKGKNAAHFAAQGGHTKILGYLLDLGIDPNARDVKGYDILHYAAMSGSLDTVQRALSACGNYESMTGWSPLHWAYRTADLPVVDLLVTSGVTNLVVATYQPLGQWTPSSIAIFHQNSKLTSETLEDSKGDKIQHSTRPDFTDVDTSLVRGVKHGGFFCNECLLVSTSCPN